MECGWGEERCAELAAESSWLVWLLTYWPNAFAFGVLLAMILYFLPAAGWTLIAEEFRRHRKEVRRSPGR